MIRGPRPSKTNKFLSIRQDNQLYTALNRIAEVLAQLVIGVGELAAHVYRTTSTSIANNTWTSVTWEFERYDTADYWTSGTNIVIPEDGTYRVNGWVHFANNTTGDRALRLQVGGGTFFEQMTPTLNNSTDIRFSGGTEYNFSKGNIVTMDVFQDSGGSLNLLGAHLTISLIK